MTILLIIVGIVVLYFYDLYQGKASYELYLSVKENLNKLKKTNPESFKHFMSLYGKEWDELGHKEIYGDFPQSLITNYKTIQRLEYMNQRIWSYPLYDF